MSAVLSPNPASWSSTHPITAEDKVAMAALRAMVEPLKGTLQGTAARQPFDAIMEHVPAPEGVRFEADTVGGVSGWWCRPSQAKSEHVILHLHGGWFNWGVGAGIPAPCRPHRCERRRPRLYSGVPARTGTCVPGGRD
jgi:acetyl esterase/lipase